MNNAIGGVEVSSVAKGFFVADAMLKAARVRLLISRSICPGKYLIIVAGEVAETKSSCEAAEKKAGVSLIDTFLIPNVHPDVIEAVGQSVVEDRIESLGIIEGFSVSALIEAADAAVKAASVKLLEITLAMALGGKAFASFTGSVAAVETAAKAGSAVLSQKGLLVGFEVIPQPKKELIREII